MTLVYLFENAFLVFRSFTECYHIIFFQWFHFSKKGSDPNVTELIKTWFFLFGRIYPYYIICACAL